MRNIILLLAVLLAFSSSAFAEDIVISHKYIIESQDRIDKIGFNLLNSNGIEQRMVFDFNTRKEKNSSIAWRDNQVTLYRTLFDRLKTDDEIAAVLSHEIAHGIEMRNGAFKGYFSYLHFSWLFGSKKYEYMADKRGVDYMVNAGYNPVAMIVVFNKAFSQTRYDWCNTHPLISRRVMEIYEYIYKKYPEYLVNNEYKDDVFYQNFLLTSKQNRAKFQDKVQTKSKRKVRYQ